MLSSSVVKHVRMWLHGNSDLTQYQHQKRIAAMYTCKDLQQLLDIGCVPTYVYAWQQIDPPCHALHRGPLSCPTHQLPGQHRATACHAAYCAQTKS